MMYKLCMSVNDVEFEPMYEIIYNVKLFVHRLKIYTAVGYKIYKIERVE